MKRYIDLLLKYDDIDSWEYPKEFNYTTSSQRVREVQTEIKNILDIEFKLSDGSSIQDASFYATLNIFSQVEAENRWHNDIEISFSRFGDFVSIWGEDIKKVDEYPVYSIIDILIKHGFIYIPQVVLNQDYSGGNQYIHTRAEQFGRLATWGYRYFSWV